MKPSSFPSLSFRLLAPPSSIHPSHHYNSTTIRATVLLPFVAHLPPSQSNRQSPQYASGLNPASTLNGHGPLFNHPWLFLRLSCRGVGGVVVLELLLTCLARTAKWGLFNGSYIPHAACEWNGMTPAFYCYPLMSHRPPSFRLHDRPFTARSTLQLRLMTILYLWPKYVVLCIPCCILFSGH